MDKITVYTAITNNKDKERRDIQCFNENSKFISPVLGAKIYKILPHKFLDCDISIWMDGNIYLNITKEQAVNEWLGDNDIAVFRHYKSKDLDWELKWIKYKFGRHSEVSKEAETQVKHYSEWDIRKEDMAMGGFIIRRHTPLVDRFNEAWWAEICRWGQRDQLSLPIILESFSELKVNRIDKDIKNCSELIYKDHNHYLT